MNMDLATQPPWPFRQGTHAFAATRHQAEANGSFRIVHLGGSVYGA